ncbi:hypothetical protein WJX73_000154 [Symbiochloris irregularis]|uniref:Germin-like protein n=1 Tax=Symbiochloris irregularis TaxID=706552 RepID=A0AAW1PSH4_9CHLO
MAKSTPVFVLALVAFGAAVTNAQPFTVTPQQFEPFPNEASTRIADNYTGFVFDYDKGTPLTVTPNGMLIPNQVSQNPYLSTLPDGGNGQAILRLGPCAGNTPHTHPRGSEISFMLYGTAEFGMVEENDGNNKLVIYNITQNQTIHIPQGILHFSHNPTCEPAAFLANFPNRDPGVQSMWPSMMRIPTHILNGATGIDERLINGLKAFPIVTTPGTGGEECLKRCNLTFAANNVLTPLNASELVA